MAIEIIGTGKAVPSNRVTNDDLAARIDTSDEWIRSHTGIGSRHLADESTATSDLALEAAKNALAMVAGFTENAESGTEKRDRAAVEAAKSIDFIVVGTATPDFIGCPSTACIVQHKLGANRAAAMDITAGCTGFIYALETAAGLLNLGRGRKRALVIGAEILSRVTDWTDRGTCVLFGDGAGAVVIEKTDAPCEGPGRRGLVQTLLYADGSGGESLVFRRGGSRNPFKTGEVIEKGIYLEMNGQEVYNFAVKAVADTAIALMQTAGIGADDIAWIVPHQANARIVQAAGKRLKIPAEKFYLNIEEYANTSAATIPLALDELNRNGKIKKGDIIMTIGFGGGLTYGGNIIVW
ncbi:MAG: ketoacyl-ACP synthase III [Treponema sp.]|jgi:3-oxoacyl-[acyl-carrier-protein] synthase-3|nr:ketoacyl-ACP synthase III [Treponema sp.]